MVNMSPEDLQRKYEGNLNSEMTGPLHNLIAKVRITASGVFGTLPHRQTMITPSSCTSTRYHSMWRMMISFWYRVLRN